MVETIQCGGLHAGYGQFGPLRRLLRLVFGLRGNEKLLLKEVGRPVLPKMEIRSPKCKR